MRYSTFFLIGTMLAAGTAQAANTAVNVKGKITPPACSADISEGADLDWGSIAHSDLSDTDFTVLSAKPATIKVSCEDDTKTRIAFWATDANIASAIAGKKVPNTTGNNGNELRRVFGIGLDPVTGKQIGNFTMIGKTSSYDGTENNTYLGYTDSGSAHNVVNFAAKLFSEGWAIGSHQEWTVLDNTSKQAVSASEFTFTFDVVPQINKKSQITNAQEVPFAGTAQFFVRYF